MYRFVSDIENNFCTQHVLPMFCKKMSFWQRFTCTIWIHLGMKVHNTFVWKLHDILIKLSMSNQISNNWSKCKQASRTFHLLLCVCIILCTDTKKSKTHPSYKQTKEQINNLHNPIAIAVCTHILKLILNAQKGLRLWNNKGICPV